MVGMDYTSQLVDPDLLQDRLLESLWYLHSQPPLYNLFVGAVLRWSPVPDAASFQVVYLALGLALVAGLYDLARQVGTSRRWAVAIAVAVGCNPATVIYEHWLAYEYPVAVALVWVVALTGRWVHLGRLRHLAALVGLAAVTVLTRSLMHPVWFLAVVVLALAARRPPRWTWQPVAVLVLPAVAVAGVLVKNQVLFDSPAMSSWFGFNLHKVTVDSLPVHVRDRLYEQGVLATGEPPDCEPDHPGIPVLAEKYKRGWRGEEQIRNWNYECLLPFFDELGSEAVAAARAEPGYAIKGVIGSFEIWAGPSTFYPGVFENRRQLDRLETLWRRTAMASFAWEPPVAVPAAWGIAVSAPQPGLHVSVTIVLATAAVAAAGVVITWQWRRRGLSPGRAVVLMGAGTVVFVTLAGTLFEHGENNRIRFVVEPLTLALAASLVLVVTGRVRRQRSLDAGRVLLENGKESAEDNGR